MSVRAFLSSPNAGDDERRQTRHRLSLGTSAGRPGEAATSVLIHNASISGMLLETGLVLAQGEMLLVDLPETEPVTARIVWSSGRLYGCEFETPITPAVLSAAQLRSDARLPEGVGQSPASFRPAAQGLGKRIEQLRKKRGLTLAHVANALGVSKPTVWAWEKGKARPLEDRLPAIALALGVEMSELAEISRPAGAEDVIRTSRINVAQAYGTSPDKVRIMIEL